MVGLLVASPIFAALSKRFTPFKLIGVELTVWTLAAVGCGFSYNFWMIAVFSKKNLWLGLFYMCIPAGVALGYVFGGYVGNHFGWRWTFYIEAIAMALFVVLSFCINPPLLKGFVCAEECAPPRQRTLFKVGAGSSIYKFFSQVHERRIQRDSNNVSLEESPVFDY